MRVVTFLHRHRLGLLAAEYSSNPELLRARTMERGERELRELLPTLPKEKRDQLLQPGLDLHY
jgi:hypothetical protein